LSEQFCVPESPTLEISHQLGYQPEINLPSQAFAPKPRPIRGRFPSLSKALRQNIRASRLFADFVIGGFTTQSNEQASRFAAKPLPLKESSP